jgi:VCBS repeat-containing protein
MATSTILNITQIAESQTNKYVTHNDAINALEQAGNDIHVNAAVTDPETITEAEAVGHAVFEMSGGVANFDIVMPSQINAINAKRVFFVNNLDTTYTATIKASSGTGAEVTLRPGEAASLYQDYEDIYLLSMPADTAGPIYDIGFYMNGAPTGAQEMFKITAARSFEFPDEFAGSVGDSGVNPTASTVLTVKRNGGSIGTITISTTGTFTFVSTATTVEAFAIGDELSVDNQATADATAADISVTFKGNRT